MSAIVLAALSRDRWPFQAVVTLILLSFLAVGSLILYAVIQDYRAVKAKGPVGVVTVIEAEIVIDQETPPE